MANNGNPAAFTPATDDDLAAAEWRGMEAEVSEVRAVSAHYEASSGHLVLGLRGGAVLLVPVRLLQGVAGAPPELIEKVEILCSGMGLHWEELDADLLVQDLAAGSFGTLKWMRHLIESGALDSASIERQELLSRLRGGPTVREIARRAGSVKSEAKTAASRANGAKGGRPRKSQLTTAR